MPIAQNNNAKQHLNNIQGSFGGGQGLGLHNISQSTVAGPYQMMQAKTLRQNNTEGCGY
jgi:hypothetical protein